MTKDKQESHKIEIITCLVIIFLAIIGIILIRVFEKPEIIVYKEEYEVKEIRFDDSHKEISREKVTKFFSMAGLEELDTKYIINYLYLDEAPECLCFNEYRDCQNCEYYSSSFIGAWLTMDELFRYYHLFYYDHVETNKTEIIFYSVDNIKFNGEGIRYYGDKLKNLRYDMNNIEVSFDVVENSLPFEIIKKPKRVEVERSEDDLKHNLKLLESRICYNLCELKGINASSERCFRLWKEQGWNFGCGQRKTFDNYESWLEENCECIETKNKKGEIAESTNPQGDIFPVPKHIRLNSDFWYCSKFKCGDYFVGVKP